MLRFLLSCVAYLPLGVCGSLTAQYTRSEGAPHYEDYRELSISQIAAQQLNDLTSEELDENWSLNDFFGNIKVIGDISSPRYPQLIQSLAEVGLAEEQFELWPCVDGAALDKSLWSRVPDWAGSYDWAKQGIAGCCMAHYKLIKDTQKKYHLALKNYVRLQKQSPPSNIALKAAKKEVAKYSSVLIMEDNNAFGLLINGVPTLEGKGRKFREALEQLPDDWDQLYFVCIHGEYEGYPLGKEVPGSPLLLKAVYGLGTKCFAVKANAYEKLVKEFERSLYPKLFSRAKLLPSDRIIAELHKKINAYMPKEPFCYRFSSPSQVSDAGSTIQTHWQSWPR